MAGVLRGGNTLVVVCICWAIGPDTLADASIVGVQVFLVGLSPCTFPNQSQQIFLLLFHFYPLTKRARRFLIESIPTSRVDHNVQQGASQGVLGYVYLQSHSVLGHRAAVSLLQSVVSGS